jgi:CDGSH-type Zn-finger protein
MADPKIAATSPAVMKLKPGKYFWCACGESLNQPFCDGSHKGTEFRPQLLELHDKKQVALCQCKHTGNQPFCDGSHRDLS